MIRFFDNFEKFKKEVLELGCNIEINKISDLDFPFFESQDKFALVYIPEYNVAQPKNFILMSKEYTFAYTSKELDNYGRNFKQIIKKPYGESTLITFLLLKNVLKNYSGEFEKIRSEMNRLDLNPILERIENAGRALRRLTDRIEELFQLMIVLKEREIKQFNTKLISFDYEILNAETRYWLDRCRSHVYRIASLRTKSEMKSNKELNETMKRLTVIITFLTIVSIVVNVPGTIGAIFGIPALSDFYFRGNAVFLVLTLILATLLSIVLGYLYWKSLKLQN